MCDCNDARLQIPFVPAQATTQGHRLRSFDLSHWVPAFAGTNGDESIQKTF
jgi:hypothetical protein